LLYTVRGLLLFLEISGVCYHMTETGCFVV